ncbi:MAG: hypothetical protein NTY88_10475 [Bacteroidetes bacterium]|nr:hypothetical protein [Bacteroidota bacterium]
MKKFAILFLLFIYMIPAIGISVTGHYCGGRLVKVTMNLPEDGTCVCGNKQTKRLLQNQNSFHQTL